MSLDLCFLFALWGSELAEGGVPDGTKDVLAGGAAGAGAGAAAAFWGAVCATALWETPGEEVSVEKSVRSTSSLIVGRRLLDDFFAGFVIEALASTSSCTAVE
jgi:hypothetical protein